MGEMKFSGLVNAYINPSLVEEPIPGVKIYDGFNLGEFDPEITIEHNDTEPLGKVVKSFKSDEGFTCTIEPKDMKAFRKIIGFPAEPIHHKKLNRKSFKKALMAWGYSETTRKEYVIMSLILHGGAVAMITMLKDILIICGGKRCR